MANTYCRLHNAIAISTSLKRKLPISHVIFSIQPYRQGDNCGEISRLRVYFKVSIFCLKILLDNVIESYRADYVYL